jgi:hypothetical protein
MKLVTYSFISLLGAIVFFGCATTNPARSDLSVLDINQILIGAWNGSHVIEESNYKRLWITVFREDKTYFVSHLVSLDGKPPSESLSSGKWKIDGDQYLESRGRQNEDYAISYTYSIVNKDEVHFTRDDGYNFTLKRVK